jgi:hypothetical protein
MDGFSIIKTKFVQKAVQALSGIRSRIGEDRSYDPVGEKGKSSFWKRNWPVLTKFNLTAGRFRT